MGAKKFKTILYTSDHPYTNLSTARMVMMYRPYKLDAYCYQQADFILIDKSNIKCAKRNITPLLDQVELPMFNYEYEYTPENLSENNAA